MVHVGTSACFVIVILEWGESVCLTIPVHHFFLNDSTAFEKSPYIVYFQSSMYVVYQVSIKFETEIDLLYSKSQCLSTLPINMSPG